ncbi:MAG: hypothetical protein Q3988_02385 [Gemella sp.]|nr:hypothetical protein [Gemella sp.]
MRSSDYKYDKNLISKLAYDRIVEKYGLDKENVNQAIYYAVTSLDSHINSLIKIENSEENVLLGDYYSFEYYNLVQGNLLLLNKISSHMSDTYKYLQTGNLEDAELYHIIFNLYVILLGEYDIKMDNEDIDLVIEAYENTYHSKLSSVVDVEFNKENLLEKARAMNDREV